MCEVRGLCVTAACSVGCDADRHGAGHTRMWRGTARVDVAHAFSLRVPRRDGVCGPRACVPARTLCWREPVCWRDLCAGAELVCRPGGCQPAFAATPCSGSRASGGRARRCPGQWRPRRVRPSRQPERPRTGHRVRAARCGCLFTMRARRRAPRSGPPAPPWRADAPRSTVVRRRPPAGQPVQPVPPGSPATPSPLTGPANRPRPRARASVAGSRAAVASSSSRRSGSTSSALASATSWRWPADRPWPRSPTGWCGSRPAGWPPCPAHDPLAAASISAGAAFGRP